MTQNGPEERPMRNTLDDRLRALETILAFPNGRIDDLNRRKAQRVIIDARKTLAAQATPVRKMQVDVPPELIAELRHDAGDYGHLMRNEVEIYETVAFDLREERAWRAADLLEALS